MNIIQQLEKEEADRLLAKRASPEFQPGDTVPVKATTRISPYARSASAKASSGFSRSCRR
jgi:ribosomal protein L19